MKIKDDDLELIDIDSEPDREKERRRAERKKKKRQKAMLKEILGNSLFLLAVFLITLCLVKFVGQRTVVVGSSMESTLQDGDNLIVDKISYRFSEPKRFDIIVFPFSYESGTYYIKRIIGLPGETVRIDDDGNIFINNELLEEHYGREVMTDPGIAEDGIVLGENQYFVLGDNRNHSSDSRTSAVGLIQRERIIGRAWVRIYPFNKFGNVNK